MENNLKYNPIYKILEQKEDSTVYPQLIDSTYNDAIDRKEHFYDDLIRMNTSDRNKAKSTIAVLNNVYYEANVTIQLLYGLFKEDALQSLNDSEKEYMFTQITKLFDASDDILSHKGEVVVGEESNIISRTIFEFEKLYKYLLKACISATNLSYSLSNVVDIIVHGEISESEFIKSMFPYQSSKLVTSYINHLKSVNYQLRTTPVTYLKNVLELKESEN